MKTMGKKIMKFLCNNKIYLFLWTVIFSNPMMMTAYADVDFRKLKIYTGTVDILSAGANAILGITILVTAVMCLIKGLAWQVADEQEKPAKKKAIINTFIGGVIIASIMGLISVGLKAYGLKDETGKVKEAAIYILNYYLI